MYVCVCVCLRVCACMRVCVDGLMGGLFKSFIVQVESIDVANVDSNTDITSY